MILCSKNTLATLAVALCLVPRGSPILNTVRAEEAKTPASVAEAVDAASTNGVHPELVQAQAATASGSLHDTAPPRQAVGLHWLKNGWVYNCMECHKVVQARWHYDQPPNEHKQIRLEHGNNRFCLNCHHPTNRNAFVDYDGAEIAEANVVQLCAKCHGTIYRDWIAGVHGRENGFWKASLGTKTKLRCIECHDPHSPRLKPLEPLPPLRYPPRGAHPPALPHSAAAAQKTGP